MSQGALTVQYRIEKKANAFTRYAGLLPYIELLSQSQLLQTIQHHFKARTGRQGWTDGQFIFSLILLNLIGGQSVSDIDLLEQDTGLCQIIHLFEKKQLNAITDDAHPGRWRYSKTRTFPSPSAIFDFLYRFHRPDQEPLRHAHSAFIPAYSELNKQLQAANQHWVAFAQSLFPQQHATLDQDATLIRTYKRQAQFCYKKYRAYQPFNTYWFEHDLLLHSEFRDGNVPAGFEQKRLLIQALEQLPAGVKNVYLRSDSAGYQCDLMKYCAEGQNARFSKIGFAITAKMSAGLKQVIVSQQESAWQPLYKQDAHGHLVLTDYQWSDVNFVPEWVSYKKSNPTYRYIAIRAPLKRGKGDDSLEDETCFTTSQAAEQAYKLSCLVSNRLEMAGGDLVNWHRARCGCSEAVHHYQKTGLSGGRLPSQYFGANVAWWLIMNLALNLEKIMQRLVANTKTKPQKSCLCHPYHLKKSRFCFICLPGHLVRHGRYLFLGLAPQCDWIKRILVNIRRQVHRLGQGPPRACLD